MSKVNKIRFTARISETVARPCFRNLFYYFRLRAKLVLQICTQWVQSSYPMQSVFIYGGSRSS